MNVVGLYTLVGVAIWVMGLLGLMLLKHPLRRIIAVNLMSSGVFLVLVAQVRETGDPVLQALVVTGLVVAVSATAFAVRLSNAMAHHQEQSRQSRGQKGDSKE